MFTRNQKTKAAFAVIALALTGAANAAVLTVPQEITDAGASVLVIGAAVFAVAVGVKLYKWIRAAL